MGDWTRYESIGKLFGFGIPYAEEQMTTPVFTKIIREIEGYVLCCASFDENFTISRISRVIPSLEGGIPSDKMIE